MDVFRSIHHPGTAGLGLAIARAQAQPVALAFVGLMIITLGGVLQGAAVWPLLLWGAPLTYIASASWGIYTLHRQPAEIVLRNGFGVIRSAWDVAKQRDEPSPFTVRFEPVFEPGRKEGVRFAAIGDRILPLQSGVWPQYDDLLVALNEAAHDLERSAPV